MKKKDVTHSGASESQSAHNLCEEMVISTLSSHVLNMFAFNYLRDGPKWLILQPCVRLHITVKSVGRESAL